MLQPEGCPVDKTITAQLWELNKPVLDELRTIVDPLADTLGEYVEAGIATDSNLLHEAQTTYVQHEIPFGLPYTLLPPRLFSGLYDGSEAPILPRNESQARACIAEFVQRYQEPPKPGMPESAFTSLHQERLGHILDDMLWMSAKGVTIDPGIWERYRQAAREQAENGRYDMDIIPISRGNSIKGLYHYPDLGRLADGHATGSFESYMAMPTVALDLDGKSAGLLPVGYLFMPVGAYGERFSEKMLRTTTYMVNAAQASLTTKAEQLGELHQETISKHMARGRDGRPAKDSLISTVQEGSRSVMETTALLMAEEVDGYEDADQLFEALVDQGIIEELTRALPMGMLGPLVFAGKYFPGLVEHRGDGRLRLNPDIMNEIKNTKRAMMVRDLGDWMLYWSTPEEDRQEMEPPLATSLLCPAAVAHGALRRMNRAHRAVYTMFDF